MFISQAAFVTNLATSAMIGLTVLSVGFMLCFLIALTKERKRNLVRCRVEYRIDSPLPHKVTGQPRRTFSGLPVSQPSRNQRAYDRGVLSDVTAQALKEVALTREYRFTDGSWQELKRA